MDPGTSIIIHLSVFPFINPSIRLLIYPSIICARAPTSQCRFASIRLSTSTPYLHTVLRPYLPSLPIYIVAASTYLSLPNHHLHLQRLLPASPNYKPTLITRHPTTCNLIPLPPPSVYIYLHTSTCICWHLPTYCLHSFIKIQNNISPSVCICLHLSEPAIYVCPTF